MLKLSRAGWNNVIIFGVMGFILLINATHDNVFSSKEAESQSRQIFAEHSVILTLSIGQDIKVERIGKTWRMSPSNMSNQALSQMMMSWHSLSAETTVPPKDIDPQLALTVQIEFAGQSQPVDLSVHAQSDQLLVFHHQQQVWYMVPMQLFSQLIPTEVFG